jgi:hypothetical protein
MQSSVPECVRGLYRAHRWQQSHPTFDEISKALDSVVAGYFRAFIIIDALDECQAFSEGRDKFLLEIFKFQAKTNANLFATSRFIPGIKGEFDKRESILLEIRAKDEDVKRYLEGHMTRLPSFVKNSPNLQGEIQTEMAGAVDGMYVHSCAF